MQPKQCYVVTRVMLDADKGVRDLASLQHAPQLDYGLLLSVLCTCVCNLRL